MTDTVAPTVEAPVAPPPRRRLAKKNLIVDAVIVIGLFTIALLLRRHFPSDGLFYDDAWQALGAIEGSFRQFMMVGQTQPGYGLEMLAWVRVFGSGASSTVVPAMIAGALGPPALYLALRKFRYAVSISLLLAAALTVCETAITYSGRVKSYTTDVLIVLLLIVLLPWLARRRWTAATAVGWFVGSVAVASFSSFPLLASAAAGAVLVFHARGDRKIRVISVGAQAVAVAALLALEDRTHDVGTQRAFFRTYESYIYLHLNPVTFVSEIVKHLVRITDVFPGGPGWLSAVCMIAAAAGLVVMAWRGSMAVVGRFFILLIVFAMLGAFAHRVPFGPTMPAARVTLWLAPVVAFGLAVVLQRVYRAASARGDRARVGFDVVAFGLSALLLASAIGVDPPYPPAGALAARRVMAEAGPNDVVIITRPAIYTFALDAGTRVHLRPTPSLNVGFVPEFDDPRLHPIDLLTLPAEQEISTALQHTNRAYVVDSPVGADSYKQYRADLASLIAAAGFKKQSSKRIGTGTVTLWQRQGRAGAPR